MIKKIRNFLKKKKGTLPKYLKGNSFKNKFGDKGKKGLLLLSKFAEYLNNILMPEQRAKAHRIFIYLFITSFFFGIGSIVALFLQGPIGSLATSVKPITPTKDIKGLKKELTAIKDINLFNAGSDKDKIPSLAKIVKGKECTYSDVASNLPFKLMHTTVLQDSVKSLASVQARGDRRILDIREGERLKGMAKIGRIGRQKIFFRNMKSGQCEFIENIKQAKSKKEKPAFKIHSEKKGKKILSQSKDKRIVQDGNKFIIKKSLKNEMMGNISEVLTQARAIQIKNPDGTYAFKMTEVVPGSVYSKLNIENGDIIEEINGNKINDLNQVMSLFSRIDSIDKLKLTIKKNGDSQVFDYQFE